MDSPRAVPRPDSPLLGFLARRWRKDLLFFGIALSIIAADQLTKWLVRANLALGETWPADSDAFIRILHVINTGAAFGILQGQTTFLIATSLLGLAAILLYYVYPPMDHGLIRIALGMQLGGAAGNLIDRVLRGEVTDFIDVGNFPTFNIADAAITISIVAVLSFFVLQEAESARQRALESEVPAAQEDDAGRERPDDD